MNILFIHGNYPAQFRLLAQRFGIQNTHDVRFLTSKISSECHEIKGVRIHNYDRKNLVTNSFASEAQAIINEHIQNGEIIQRKILELISNDFTPNLIFYHGGSGLGLFLKQILPKSTLIGYFEWYFSSRCANIILNREDLASQNFIRSRNICIETEINLSDSAVVPTEWQASQFPSYLRNHLSVIFDGVDTDFFKPNPRSLEKNEVYIKGETGSISIQPDELLFTYATRGMEPLRGFPEFMQALPQLLERLPNLKILIGGRDRSAYGPVCHTHDGSWLKYCIDLHPSLKNHPRIFYTGLMDYGNYRLMMHRSNLHCYLTKPYVTSWSLFEAAACGTPVITNESSCTTGTIPVPIHNTIKELPDLFAEAGIKKIIRLLKENKTEHRTSYLPDKYNIKATTKQWEAEINKSLTKKKFP